MTPSNPASDRNERIEVSRDGAIDAWRRLYGGNDVDVAADVGKFWDAYIVPALATAEATAFYEGQMAEWWRIKDRPTAAEVEIIRATERASGGLDVLLREALDPMTDEWVVFERAYGRKPTAAEIVSRYLTHGRVPQKMVDGKWTGGYDCSGKPCRCPVDPILNALARLTPQPGEPE